MRSAVKITIEGEGASALDVHITADSFHKMTRCQAALDELNVITTSELSFLAGVFNATVSDRHVTFSDSDWQSKPVKLEALDTLFNVKSACFVWNSTGHATGPSPRVTVPLDVFTNLKALFDEWTVLTERFNGLQVTIPIYVYTGLTNAKVLSCCPSTVDGHNVGSLSCIDSSPARIVLKDETGEFSIPWFTLLNAFEGELA